MEGNPLDLKKHQLLYEEIPYYNTRIEQHVSSCRREHHSENDVSTFKHLNDALA